MDLNFGITSTYMVYTGMTKKPDNHINMHTHTLVNHVTF